MTKRWKQSMQSPSQSKWKRKSRAHPSHYFLCYANDDNSDSDNNDDGDGGGDDDGDRDDGVDDGDKDNNDDDH